MKKVNDRGEKERQTKTKNVKKESYCNYMFLVTQALFDFIAQNLLGLDNYMKNIFTQIIF